MVKKAPLAAGGCTGALRAIQKKAQRYQGACCRFAAGDKAAFHRNGVNRQRKTDGSDTRRALRARTISNQTVIRIGFVPEIVKGNLLQVIDQLFIGSLPWIGVRLLTVVHGAFTFIIHTAIVSSYFPNWCFYDIAGKVKTVAYPELRHEPQPFAPIDSL